MPKTRSASKRDAPSTSKLDSDPSEAKTPDRADLTKTPEPERPESPQNCSICLSSVENKSFTDSCLHTFCYVCLLEWSKVKAVCPLCKQNFKKIIYNVRSLDDFDEYVIPPPQPARDHLWENFNALNYGMRFRYRTTLTQDRMLEYQRRRHPSRGRALGAPGARPVSREETRRRRSQQAVHQRRRIYEHDMWVEPVSPTRYRETSPQFYTENEACRYSLIPWLTRELSILLNGYQDNVHFVLELILDLIQRHHIRSDQFYEMVHPLIGRHSRHFIHEFYHFARSPYDLATYDQRATYRRREEDYGRGRAEDFPGEESEDDVMVVEEEETLSRMLSRQSGVPLANIGPINVEWNISSTLGEVRSFLQNAMAQTVDQASSGARQMARIHSHHNYAGRDVTSDDVASDRAVNVEDTSDDDVIFVRAEKPYHERSPIVLSSDEGENPARRRSESRRPPRSRSHRERRSRSREKSSKSRDHKKRKISRDRRSRSRSRLRSKDRRSRSRDRRSRSRDRSTRSRDQRSRSRDRRRGYESTSSRSHVSKSRGLYERTYPRRRSRSRSRSRPRSRSRSARRASSADSVTITRVRRKKAKKHKRHKKHKKHHKRRRLSSTREPEIPSTSGDNRKYKKHPTGHKSSKRKDSQEVSAASGSGTAPEAVISSGFESGDFSADSPADVIRVCSDVTMSSDVVKDVLDEVINRASGCDSTWYVTRAGTSHVARGEISHVVHGDQKLPSMEELRDGITLGEGAVEKLSVTDPKATRGQPSSPAGQGDAGGDLAEAAPRKTPAPSEGAPVKSPEAAPVKSPAEAAPAADSDSDCVMHADDDVVFEGECRCRARNKCSRCLHSGDSSDSDSDSDERGDQRRPRSPHHRGSPEPRAPRSPHHRGSPAPRSPHHRGSPAPRAPRSPHHRSPARRPTPPRHRPALWSPFTRSPPPRPSRSPPSPGTILPHVACFVAISNQPSHQSGHHGNRNHGDGNHGNYVEIESDGSTSIDVENSDSDSVTPTSQQSTVTSSYQSLTSPRTSLMSSYQSIMTSHDTMTSPHVNVTSSSYESLTSSRTTVTSLPQSSSQARTVEVELLSDTSLSSSPKTYLTLDNYRPPSAGRPPSQGRPRSPSPAPLAPSPSPMDLTMTPLFPLPAPSPVPKSPEFSLDLDLDPDLDSQSSEAVSS